jgi:hypothetical protein
LSRFSDFVATVFFATYITIKYLVRYKNTGLRYINCSLKRSGLSVMLESGNDVLVNVLVPEQAADLFDGVLVHGPEHPGLELQAQLLDVLCKKQDKA